VVAEAVPAPIVGIGGCHRTQSVHEHVVEPPAAAVAGEGPARLTLERLADTVPAGERQRLTLRMTRVLRVGGDQAEALQAPGTSADVELEVTVRGDPEELDRLTEELARAVHEDTQPGSVAREQALTTLLALRTPAAARHVASLREHPDAGVRARAGA